MQFSHGWSNGPLQPSLSTGEIHVWCASLGPAGGSRLTVSCHLRGNEMARAGRYPYAKDRVHFVAARGILRDLLSRYLGVHPRAVTLTEGEWGKPRLSGAHRGWPLAFNLSRSGDLGLFAFCSAGEVGIDIEATKPVPERMRIAERFFSPRERTALQSKAPADQQVAFFRFWTGREAVAKAHGMGLREWVAGRSDVNTDWIVLPVDPAEGYIASLAARNRHWSIHRWLWNPSRSEQSAVVGDQGKREV
jgi:4'-phosphopantetheinyl transferase